MLELLTFGAKLQKQHQLEAAISFKTFLLGFFKVYTVFLLHNFIQDRSTKNAIFLLATYDLKYLKYLKM